MKLLSWPQCSGNSILLFDGRHNPNILTTNYRGPHRALGPHTINATSIHLHHAIVIATAVTDLIKSHCTPTSNPLSAINPSATPAVSLLPSTSALSNTKNGQLAPITSSIAMHVHVFGDTYWQSAHELSSVALEMVDVESCLH